MVGLSSLPDELIVKIYEHADKEHLIGGLSESCSRFHQISRFDPLWKLICTDIWISMCYNSKEISKIENYRQFFFKTKKVIHKIIDILVSFESSYKYNSTNDGNIDLSYDIIKEICDYGEYALPALEMALKNSDSLLIPSLAMICTRIIFRRRGVNQLMDVIDCLEGSNNGLYSSIDLVTSLLLIHNGYIEKRLRDIIYDPESDFKVVGNVIIKSKATRFATEALIQLRERLHELKVSTSPTRGFFIDTQYGLFPCFQGICDGFPYHIFFVLEKEDTDLQFILPCSPFGNPSSGIIENDIYRTIKQNHYPKKLDNLLVIDMDTGCRIRNIKEILYLFQVNVDNSYRKVMRNRIKDFFNIYLSSGLGKGDNFLRMKIQQQFLSILFYDQFTFLERDKFDDILKLVVQERYYNQISWHRQVRRTNVLIPFQLTNRLDYFDFGIIISEKIRNYIPYRKFDYECFKYRVGDFVKTQGSYFLIIGFSKTQNNESCYNALSKEKSIIIKENEVKIENDNSFVVSNYVVSSWNFTQGYLLTKDMNRNEWK